MTNEKTIQLHTHRISAGAECSADRPCAPMDQAMRKGWILGFNNLPYGRDEGLKRGVCVGDVELGYLSLFRFCPFCAVNLEAFPRYVQFHEGEPVMRRYEPATGKNEPVEVAP